MASTLGEISTAEYDNMVEQMARAMAEVDAERYWKTGDVTARETYQKMAKRHLAAQRVFWDWTHR